MLEETKAKIRTNSKDAHFADALISDLLSIKGQLDHEPTLIHIPISDVTESIDSGPYEASITKDGTAIYHAKGGYTVIADYRMAGLNYGIRGLITGITDVDSITDEEREAVDLDLSASAYVISIPVIAFSDPEFKLDMATAVVKYLNKTYDKAINAPLQEDDMKLNKEFEDAIIGSIDVSDTMMGLNSD